MFELSVENTGGHVIHLKGEIDIYSASDFKERLYNSIGEGGQDVILDCSDLSYIDSMGLGILVGALKRIKQQNHDIVIKNPKSTVRKLFRITGLDKVFIMEEAGA
ncbi:MAG TPA: anti-sigma factor antagonist [Ruminiclostridium sp.]|jgi:anti-sigma B factor antagonist|nr:anti-sigma factor antagonist [Ruminiclostridium sp.]